MVTRTTAAGRERAGKGGQLRVTTHPKNKQGCRKLVSKGGLEPPRPLRALAPQASASAIPPLRRDHRGPATGTGPVAVRRRRRTTIHATSDERPTGIPRPRLTVGTYPQPAISR